MSSIEVPDVFTEVHKRLEDRRMKSVAPGEIDPEYRNVTVSLYLVNIVQLNTRENFLDAVYWIHLVRRILHNLLPTFSIEEE